MAMPRPDPEDRELLRHLFAKSTALLEDAAAIGLKGQGTRVSRSRAAAYAGRLNARVEAVRGLLAAIVALTEDRSQDGSRRR